MSHIIKNTLLRRVLKCLAALIIVILLLPALLYVPFVQDFAVDKALSMVNSSMSDMKIGLGKLRLRWPLKLELDSLTVVQYGDTMVTARRADLDVELRALLALDVKVEGTLSGVGYNMGGPDSAMAITARIDRFDLDRSTYGIRTGNIDLSRAAVDGARINVAINYTDTVAAPKDSTATEMTVKAQRLELRNVVYTMTMMPTIDSLGVDIPEAVLCDGFIDLGKHLVNARFLGIDSITAAYLTPTAEYLAAHPVDSTATVPTTPATPDSEMWTVTADSVRLSAREGLYAMRGAVPLPGLDMNYLQVSGVRIAIDSLYNRGTSLRVPLVRLSGRERCGINLNASGLFTISDSLMTAERVAISTLFSNITLAARMGMGDFTTDPHLPISLDALATIGIADLEMIAPDMEPMLRQLPRYNDLRLVAHVDGSPAMLDIKELSASLPGYVDLQARGSVENVMDPDALGGRMDLEGNMANLNFIKPTLLEAKLLPQVNLPPINLTGRVDMHRGDIAGYLRGVTGAGAIVLDADWSGRAEAYDVVLDLDDFPVNSFLPKMGVGHITAALKAKGRGYDPFSRRTSLQADLNVASAVYEGIDYTDVRLWARLDTGWLDAGIVSLNPSADLDLGVNGRLANDDYDMTFDGNVRNLDLRAMAMSPTRSKGSFTIEGRGHLRPARGFYDAAVNVTDLRWEMPDMTIATPSIDLDLLANDSTLDATLTNQTLRARFVAGSSLDSLTAQFTRAMAVIDSAFVNRRIDVMALQKNLPPFAFDLTVGDRSIIADFLAPSRTSIHAIDFNVHNDSLLHFTGLAQGIKAGDTRIDSISISGSQHGKFLLYKLMMNNRPGTWNEFAHVDATGFIADSNLSLFFNQSNIKGETGFKLGFNLTATDSLYRLRMVPLKPIIAYKTWSINADNYITFKPETQRLSADLNLTGGDNGSSVFHLYTEHVEGTPADQEDVRLNASGIRLADWLSISPFAPPIDGIAGAKVAVGWNPESRQLEGDIDVTVDNLTYGKQRVGSFDLLTDLTTDPHGLIRANTALKVDDTKVITASGVLNDSTAVNPFLLDFSMMRFPLKIVNPFIPDGMASLRGTLNGNMKVTGSPDAPIFNGDIFFDSASVKVTMLGSAFTFADTHIPVDSNVVTFDGYTITGRNANPLYIDGTVDMHSLVSPAINLKALASNMQVVGSQKGRGTDVYGKAFIDLDATVNGNLDFMRVKADLNLLEGSNVTYVMMTTSGDLSQLASSDADLVHFVEFADTAAVNAADSITQQGMSLMLDAQLTISDGTTISVDLGPTGSDKAQIQSSGTLSVTMNPFSDMRITGRLNINQGFVRYTPPIISQKLFNFIDNSYVAFNGDMMDPVLNLHLQETLRANVTEEGQNSRLINFLIALNVTGTLSQMDISFDLSTDDDISVQNELETMSPDQRANQAMNLLLYNVYTGPGTKASSSLGGNPLYSFLTSKLNNWMADNVKGVDISFGIDQYDRTLDGSTSTTTSYSYKVSKSLFDDRFKIIVGGNYSTDANSDENFSENLINDISFEYMLNRAGTMYIRLFRHTGYISILEGEVTQTGVGFVYRKKMTHFKQLFSNPIRRKTPTLPEKKQTGQTPTATTTTSTTTEDDATH